MSDDNCTCIDCIRRRKAERNEVLDNVPKGVWFLGGLVDLAVETTRDIPKLQALLEAP